MSTDRRPGGYVCFRSFAGDRPPALRSLRWKTGALALLAGVGLAGSAMADSVWIYDGTGIWSDPARWSGGIADGPGTVAWFTNNIGAARTITLDGAVASRTVGILNIGDSTSTYYAFSLAASGGGTLTFDNNDAHAELNNRPNAPAQTISIPLILADPLDVNNAAATLLTLSGGLRGTGDAALAANAAGGITVSGEVNPTGAIANVGTGAGVVTLSGGVNTNVIAIIENSTNSALTINTKPLFVNSAGTTLVNSNASGVRVLTLGINSGGTGDLVLRNDSAVTNGVTVSGAVSHTGLVVNAGTGPGNAYVTGVIGPASAGVIQDSPSSMLTLGGANTFTSGTTIRKGALRGTVAAAFGAAANRITLGDATGSADAILVGGTTHANPITVAGGNSGIASITPAAAATFSGAVTLDNHDLLLTNAAYALTLSGGLTGSGNLVFDARGVGALTVSTKELNTVGVVSNIGAGAGTATISGGVGQNVAAITQGSTSSPLTVSTKDLALNPAGTALANDGGRLFTFSAGTIGSGDLTLRNNSGLANGLTVSTRAVNHTGLVANAGSGTGAVYVSSVVGPNVAGVVQDSDTSPLILAGANTFTSGALIRRGTLRGAANAAFGAASSRVTIGDAAADADAILIGGGTHANPITVAGGNSGIAAITPVAASTFSGAVTLDSHDLILSNAAVALTLSGGLTGSGNLLLNAMGASAITLSTLEINPDGVISNIGTGAGTATLSGGVGSSARYLVQASASSPFTVSTKDITVNASGTYVINDGGKLLTLASGSTGSGDLVLRNNTDTANGITAATRTINHTGRLVNEGTGTGNTLISAVIGPNVNAVVQDSETSVLTLAGANTFTVGLSVDSNRTVRIANTSATGATGPGPVLIEAGGTVDGNGTMAGTVHVYAGGTLSPSVNGRAGAGRLTVGNLNWNGGGVFDCVVTKIEGAMGGVDYGQLVVNGDLNDLPAGTNLVIRLDTLGQTLAVNPTINYGLKLIDFASAGAISNVDLSAITVDTSAFLVSGGTWVLTNILNDLYLACLNVAPAAGQNVWIAPDPYNWGFGRWSESNNWSLGHAPLSGEDVQFDFFSTVPCWMDEVSNGVGSITVSEGFGSTIVFWSGYPGKAIHPDYQFTGDVSVKSGVLKHLDHTGGDNTAANRMALMVGGDFTLGSNAVINLDGLGYAINCGPGAGVSGTAATRRSASHGGAGAFNPSTSATYGSITQPESLGSGANGAGGGALFLQVAGTATIHGTITAQGIGGTATACPGSGGSIYIKAGTVAGTGVLRAGVDTVAAAYYGSGGGRIAVIATNSASLDGLLVRANPHSSTNNGGGRAGTVYLETPAFKRLVIDQEYIGTASSNYTVLPEPAGTFATDPAFGGPLEDVTLILTNGAFASLSRDLRMGDFAWLEGELALQSHTLYLKSAAPAGAFPADYGNGVVSLPGVFHQFENGDTVTGDGRLLWGDPSVTWRVATLVYNNEGGVATNRDQLNDGYFADGSALVFDAVADGGSPFRFWDGTIPEGAGRYDNPLSISSLAGNTALRAWFRAIPGDLTLNQWVPATGSDDWFLPFNWDLLMVPVAGQDVTIPSGSVVRLDASTPALDDVTLAAGATLTFEGWSNALEAATLTIEGTVTHLPQTVTEPDGLGEWVPQHRIFLKGGDLVVASNGVLNADYRGYLPGAGPGRAPAQPGTGDEGKGYGTGGGGGYGGMGASVYSQLNGLPYGDPADPWQPGSGGGYRPLMSGVLARPAGGAIRVEMTGQVTVNGTITARGQNATAGSSGSGGGIAILCETFQGATSGWIRADGGTCGGTGGSGGGGRIAIHYNPASQAALAEPRPPVHISAAPGTVTAPIYTTIDPVMGSLYMPDTTLLSASATGPVQLDEQRFWYVKLHLGNQPVSWSPESLAVNDCVIGFPEGYTLQVANDVTLSGTRTPATGTDRAGLHLFSVGTGDLYGSRLSVGRDFTIGANCWFYPHADGFSTSIVGVRAGRDVTVAAGGGINADRQGYMPDPANTNGPGAAIEGLAGGSYGGAGGCWDPVQSITNGTPGPVYGLAEMPLETGSPGGWRGYGNFTGTARGGGAIQVMANGTMTIDGLLSANGGQGAYYSGSGGSGGSIFLAARRFRGGATGTLAAKGGVGHNYSGPGGGGRVAVWQGLPGDAALARIPAGNLNRLEPQGALNGFTGLVDVQPGAANAEAADGTVRFLDYRDYTVILVY